MLRSGEHRQHESRVVAMAISSAEDTLTVLPENLEAAIPVGGKSRRRVQRGNSTGREPSYRCDAFDVRQVDLRLAQGPAGKRQSVRSNECDIKVLFNIVWRGARCRM
jgi:hypothetical protein